jgi:hypothetical protein
MEIGMRLRLFQDADNYPTCLIRAGETGTLMRITDEGTYWIRLDTHHPELAEWNNELEIWDWSVVEGAECHPTASLEEVS